jgi:AcrR family transcriptional regulator
MRLTAQDRRQRLLDAAADLFSRQGYKGTTTRQIAAKAGVTEALIYRHFRTKEDLYWEVIEARCKARGARSQLKQRLNSGDDIAAVFSEIGADILHRHTEDPQLYRLLLFSALENHKLSNRFFRTHMSAYYETIAERISEHIRSGRFRKTDPTLAARGFIGMLMHHFLIQELFGGKHYQKFDIEKVSAIFTKIWLAGMENTAVKDGSANGHFVAHTHGDFRKVKPSKARLKVLQAI